MRIDLIGDFRLDLDDPDRFGARNGTAKLGERTASVTVIPIPDGLYITVDGIPLWAPHMVDVAPVVKRELEE